MRHTNTRWLALTAAGVLAFVGSCGINDVLQVQNPSQIPTENLNDPKLMQVQVNGVIEAFQNAYTEPVSEWANFLTDVVLTGLNSEVYARVNQRIASYPDGPTNQIVRQLSRSLRVAPGVSARSP